MFNLRNRSFLTLMDFTPKEINFMLDLAKELKNAKYAGTETQRLKGKNVVILFEKIQQEQDVHLKSEHLMKELMLHILDLLEAIWVKRNQLRYCKSSWKNV
jgi:hypothetical protein